MSNRAGQVNDVVMTIVRRIDPSLSHYRARSYPFEESMRRKAIPFVVASLVVLMGVSLRHWFVFASALFPAGLSSNITAIGYTLPPVPPNR